MGKKRRNFTAQFKFETVMEGLRGEKSVAQICRERDLTESLYYKWRDALVERGVQVFEDSEGRSVTSRRNGSPSWSVWQASRRWRLKS